MAERDLEDSHLAVQRYLDRVAPRIGSPKPRHVPVDPQLHELERLLGRRGLLAIHRVRERDWMARTLKGVVGRGESLGEAIADLIVNLNPRRRQAGPDGDADSFDRLMRTNRGRS